jgi:hypothetical protein
MTRWWGTFLLGLALLPGCGMTQRKLQREEMISIESVSRSFHEPAHRVAVATFEVMKAELASAGFARNCEFFPFPTPKSPGASLPVKGQPLPANFPGFWLEYQAGDKSVSNLLILGSCHFSGQTHQGQAVTVEIQSQPDGTIVTVHIDRADKSISRAFLEQVTGRLAHPSKPPGSLEEAADFQAFFGGVQSKSDAKPKSQSSR